jgi:hypothetical protein
LRKFEVAAKEDVEIIIKKKPSTLHWNDRKDA